MQTVKDAMQTFKGDANEKEEPKSTRNILLETFDGIRDDLRRGQHRFQIKVRIVRGRQIQGGNVSPKVCIVFQKQRRWTQRETVSSNDPFWGESFLFECVTDVESLLRENVTFRVVNSRMFRRNLVIGEFKLSLVLVAGEKSRTMVNRWLAVADQHEPATVCKGFLQVCVALVFPNEPEVVWPDSMHHDQPQEDIEKQVLICSGHTFLKMTFVLHLYQMQDLPRFDVKGKPVAAIVFGLTFAGKTIRSKPIDMPPLDQHEAMHIRKEIRLTVSWPSMCNCLDFQAYSINDGNLTPLCYHSFDIHDIAIESTGALTENVKSEHEEEGQKKAAAEAAKSEKQRNRSKHTKQERRVQDGFMPKIGPCSVNLYGAPLDAFDDKISMKSILNMNSGVIEGCAYRGRVFMRLQSELNEFCDEKDSVSDFELGVKEQRDLQTHSRSNTFLLFGFISTIPLVSDAKSTIQFEMSIGHNGINSMSTVTNSHIYPSTSFSINPKELLKTQRLLTGHSYFSLTLDKEKPAFLIESCWEDIRYRIHFYNLVSNLYKKWEGIQKTIIMSYKLGQKMLQTVNLIRDGAYDLQQSMAQTPIPNVTSSGADMNDMDKEWKSMRFQQLKDIYRRLGGIYEKAQVAEKLSSRKLASLASNLCQQLTEISLLFDNIRKEPQLSIPDVFIYMLVNNERRAYARVSVASIYYCQSEAIDRNPVDNINRPPEDYTRYRGPMANKMVALTLKHIPGIKCIKHEDYWPIPSMIRMKMIFGLTSTMRANVLPPINYYGIKYDYTKLKNFFETYCQQNGESPNFNTDASGINVVEANSNLLKSSPTHQGDDAIARWEWTNEWLPWPDTSVLVNSDVETVYDFVYKVEMREKQWEKNSVDTWKFHGFYTESMRRIGTNKDRLDNNYAVDTKKWVVVMEKNPLTGEEVGWIEVKGFKEYSKDIRFNEKDVTSTIRLESNFSRRLLQRKRKRKDIIFTETIQITFVKGADERWSPSRMHRFDGVSRVVELDMSSKRCWTHLQQMEPMCVSVTDDDLPATQNQEAGEPLPTTRIMRFRWIDNWQEQMVPFVINEHSTVQVTFERQKIVESTEAGAATSGHWKCIEHGGSVSNSIFHLSSLQSDRVKRVRLRRSVEPIDVSLNLQSTVRHRTIKMAPFPNFSVLRRVGRRARICCLFNSIEQIPTPTTVTAVVDQRDQISRWELRCFIHEARDLITSHSNDKLYVYAIVNVGGVSAASSIIQNDFCTQLWRWNETLVFRNLIFHEDLREVSTSPPLVVIEFFRKLPIHNDQFLGRCLIDKTTFVTQLEYDKEKSSGLLQWYNVALRNSEETGCVLAGVHFRQRDTFRLQPKIFEKSFLAPSEKNMQDLLKRDRVMMDNRRRFDIPDEILPRLVPHILKITSWGLRRLRKYMLSKVTRPTIEFRIGHNCIQTESLLVEKSTNFTHMSHSLQVNLPIESSYLPELFIVVKDARAFGRTPLTGVAKLPLQLCRSWSAVALNELVSQEIDFFIDTLKGNLKTRSKTDNEAYRHLSLPLLTDCSKEFAYLLKPINTLERLTSSESYTDDGVDYHGRSLTRRAANKVMNKLGSALVDILTTGVREKQQQDQRDIVVGDEALSKTKPDWWCKYYLSRSNDTEKSISYLEGDRLEYYSIPLEEATVFIGNRVFDNRLHELVNRHESHSDFAAMKADADAKKVHHSHSLDRVNYADFSDVIETIPLNRSNQLTSDEEGRRFGAFLGKVRLYYLGPFDLQDDPTNKLKELEQMKENAAPLSYTPLYDSVPMEMKNMECLVRVYVIRALDLQSGNTSSLPNSYVEVFLENDKREEQLKNNRDASIEMDNNPVYGRMFELYTIIPFQTRLRVRVMDKSSFLMDDEIGSTTIDLEKRLTTVYRATCGLPECYRMAGINAWRDVQKPRQILNDVCRRFKMPEPRMEDVNENVATFSDSSQDDPKAVQMRHKCTIYPPNLSQLRQSISVSSQADNSNSPLTCNSSSDYLAAPSIPYDLPKNSAIGRMLNNFNASNSQKQNLCTDDLDGDTGAEFFLEDFDRINERRGIHLGPNDNEPDICRERLALNILRRLPLVREHVETRPLYNPLQPGMVQGRLEMWVDIFSLRSISNCMEGDEKLKAEEIISRVRNLLPSPVDITPREPQPYELRVVVWSIHEVISSRDSNSGDLYVRAWMEGLGDTQETDVHYNSMEGEAEYNWRFVFKLDYLPHERAICGKQKVSLFNRVVTKIPPMLHIQVWDNKRFRFNDFIGSIELNLSSMLIPARHSAECTMRNRWQMDLKSDVIPDSDNSTANIFEVQRVYGYWPLSTCQAMELTENKPGAWMVGKVHMDMEILSKEEAALKPAGLGRSEPNQHPHLPEPKRVSMNSNFWATSCVAFRRVLWPQYKWYIIGCLLAVAFLVLSFSVIVYWPFKALTGG